MSVARFTAEERDEIRRWLLESAEADRDVTGAAITGSGAIDTQDEWSDIDVAFGVAEDVDLASVIERWTELIDGQFGVVHYWDLPADDRIFRVYLLRNGLEIDIGFMPAWAFGARGPKFRLMFGEARQIGEAGSETRTHVGMGWHHVLHAAACLARGRAWEAEWLISAARDHALALACARMNLPTAYARGVDHLPDDVRDRYEESLIRSMEPGELRRSLELVRSLVLQEIDRVDASLAKQLSDLLPVLRR